MLTPTTLVGLACLISNSSPQDQVQLAERLSKAELVSIQRTIESGACLPENFEAMLKDGEAKVYKAGFMSAPAPTRECF